MHSSVISILLFAMFMLISIYAMPASFIYQNEDIQSRRNIDDDVRESPREFISWLQRRNSPLCDYRLQFRPLPLTSTLCAYG
jgi:hypothetical protein